VGEWRTVRIVLDDEFRNHFENGDSKPACRTWSALES